MTLTQNQTLTEALTVGDMVTLENVTLLMSNDMMGNWNTIPCRELQVSLTKYAQYPVAVRLNWKQPRQRRFRGVVKTPSGGPVRVVVINGLHQNVAPSMWGEKISSGDGVDVIQGKYRAFDCRWDQDMYETLEQSSYEILFDGRDIADLRKVGA